MSAARWCSMCKAYLEPHDHEAPPPSLFDAPNELEPARIEGIAKVEANTPEDWRTAFDLAIAAIRHGSTFSVYDVLAKVGKPDGVHPSAIGARMRRASHAGLVEKVGHADRASHGDVVTLWRRA